MRKINGVELSFDSLPIGDARAGGGAMSSVNAHEMAKACDRALAKRGIFTTKFNKMDMVKPKPNQDNHD